MVSPPARSVAITHRTFASIGQCSDRLVY
jgi:hypothetical protein